MADIKQAAKWMLEGKIVRQSSGDGSCAWKAAGPGDQAFIKLDGEVMGDPLFIVADLLAEDWEIAE